MSNSHEATAIDETMLCRVFHLWMIQQTIFYPGSILLCDDDKRIGLWTDLTIKKLGLDDVLQPQLPIFEIPMSVLKDSFIWYSVTKGVQSLLSQTNDWVVQTVFTNDPQAAPSHHSNTDTITVDVT